MSFGAGFKRPRPHDLDVGHGGPVPYGPPGDFGPHLGGIAGPGPIIEQGMPPLGRGMGVGLGTGPDGEFPVVKLRGLPFNSDEQEVKLFLEVDTVDIVFVKRQGRFSGEAYVVLPGMIQVDFALSKHKAYMGKRYVEVQLAYKEDYYRAVAAAIADGGVPRPAPPRRPEYSGPPDRGPGLPMNGSPGMMPRGPQREMLGRGPWEHSRGPPAFERPASGSGRYEDGGGETAVLRLRGLPFSASRGEIAAWFNASNALSQPVREPSVHLILGYDGRATGSAFVEFANASEAQNAMVRDKANMGSRYVELFHSSRDEIAQATSGGY